MMSVLIYPVVGVYARSVQPRTSVLPSACRHVVLKLIKLIDVGCIEHPCLLENAPVCSWRRITVFLFGYR